MDFLFSQFGVDRHSILRIDDCLRYNFLSYSVLDHAEIKMKQKLEADGIEFHYGSRRILSGIYLACETGTITGLLGRNGSGKSTLFQIIFGAKRGESGSVRINGSSVTDRTLSHRLIAYLPQEPLLPEFITPLQALKLYGISPKKINDHFPELSTLLHSNPSTLSGGERRLFELLLVLYSPSQFCLLDEPFSGLSPATIERVIAVLEKLKNVKGILLSDHLYRSVYTVAKKLYLLVDGRTKSIHDINELVRYGYISQGKVGNW
jgi:ABC-type multidrug transport system ATPase subunit